MVEASREEGLAGVSAVLCVGRDAFERFGSVLRHLTVGMVDQSIPLRVLSADRRVEKLTLGPIQTLLHQRIGWPLTSRRIDQIVDALSPHPPTVVHAITAESYPTAVALATAFDAELILQATSLGDCNAIARIDSSVSDSVARFVASSSPLKEMLETQLHINPNRVELIRPGVLAAEETACFGRGPHTPTVVCTSQFDPKAGIETLIRAVAILRQRELDVVVFLLGQGNHESRLRQAVRAGGLMSQITFANPRGDIGKALASSDILVRPSEDDAFYAGSLQAMAAGVAVIAFANTVTDHLRDRETAVMCREPTADALAAAMEQLITDRAHAKRIAAVSLEYVRTNHAMSTMAERTAAMYRKLALRRSTFSITG